MFNKYVCSYESETKRNPQNVNRAGERKRSVKMNENEKENDDDYDSNSDGKSE